MWVQSQQRHHRHGICPQTIPNEMQGAEQRTVCSVCGPDQTVWHSEQKGIVDVHGAPWLHPQSFSIWLTNCVAILGWTDNSLDPSPSSTARNRVVFRYRLCSASFSAWCFNMSLKILTMTVLCTSATVLTAVCLTSGDCMPAQKYLRSYYVISFRWWRGPWYPQQNISAAPHFLICRGCPDLRTGGRLEENWGPSPASTLEEYRPHCITIGGTKLKAVHQFTYLGCIITSDSTKVYGTTSIWRRTQSSASIEPSYSPSCCTTLTYRHHLRLFERFRQRCLRTLLNIHWSNHVSNVEVLDQAEITSIEAMLLKSRLRWARHVSRIGGLSPAQDSPVWWTLHSLP